MILDRTRSRRVLTRRALLLTLGLSAAALVPLAALRPGAKAQAASPSGASPFVGSPAPTLSVTDLKVNGVSLLAGVTDARKPGSSWWSASGALLPTPVYDTAAQHAEMHDPGNDAKNVTFAFRFPASLQGATVSYDLPQSSGYSSDGSWPLKTQGQDHVTEAQLNGATNGTRVVTATFPASVSKTNVRVGIASGPWTKAAGQSPTRYAGSSVTTPNGTFIFSPVTPEKGNVWGVTITTSQPKQDIRVVAVNAQGHELLPSTVGDTTAGGMDQITARFADLPLPQIKEFRVETRPYQWVEIRDIALRPAH